MSFVKQVYMIDNILLGGDWFDIINDYLESRGSLLGNGSTDIIYFDQIENGEELKQLLIKEGVPEDAEVWVHHWW